MIKANFEAEQAVCGDILMDSAKVMPIVASVLSSDDFQVPKFRMIYATCENLFRDNRPIDAVTVLPQLGSEYRQIVMEAATAAPTISNCQEYARQVRDRAQRISAYNKAADLMFMLDNDVEFEQCQSAAGEILKCFDIDESKNTVSAEEGLLNFCDRQDHPKKYISTGLSKLDKYLFLSKGDFIIVGGRPSSGKTAFTLQMMLHMAREYNVAYFSLETKPDKVFDRLISNYDSVSLSSIKRNTLTDDEWTGIVNSYSDFKNLKFHVVQAAGWTVEQIKSKVLQLKAEIIFADYLTLIKSEGKSLYEKATNISNDLHTMAQRNNVAIVALSQLNRDGKNSLDMTALRDSGAIEQDADAIMLLAYNDQKPNKRELVISKNKEGRCGRLKLDFNGDKQQFADQENRYEVTIGKDAVL
ncbi:MAG: hypothetical protein LKJ17_09390 [Oscillospiraceae bacterium]|nr:hypothetical protein [Oscillospiraceae bacterium]